MCDSKDYQYSTYMYNFTFLEVLVFNLQGVEFGDKFSASGHVCNTVNLIKSEEILVKERN